MTLVEHYLLLVQQEKGDLTKNYGTVEMDRFRDKQRDKLLLKRRR